MKSEIISTLEYSKQIIISPDMDGFVSAQLLNRYNGSVVVGAYDKNILTLADGINPEECLFVDCDMNRNNFVSIGNHMRLLSDGMSDKSFNPNVHFGVTTYTDKFPYATCFLITFATEVPTSDYDKNRMAYADSTYKNLTFYGRNMREWSNRMMHEEVNRILVSSLSDLEERRLIEVKYPTQSFTSKRYGKTRYLQTLNDALISEGIEHMPLTQGIKYQSGKIDKTTVVRYNKDIISYAEIYGGEYSVTYDQETEWS